MKRVLLFLLILLAIPLASAKEAHIKLLAVTDDNGNVTGSVADLYLEIQPGKGRVFIETFPLTKTDTQMTTRFAKDIACKYTNTDCSGFDFFYTIKSDSTIIGGPSAGAATTILTISLLKGLALNSSVAITGTINSGDVIGFVSGIKEKLQAASNANITKILIPRGQIIDRSDNKTLDLGNHGASFGVDVIEVGDIDEALTEFTGQKFGEEHEITIDPSYLKVMSELAEDLCKRNDNLAKITHSFDSRTEELKKAAINLTAESRISTEQDKPYSAASQCFSSSVRYRQIEYLSRNLTKVQIENQSLELYREMLEFENQTAAKEKETLTDLETFLIVKERLADARETLQDLPGNDLTADAENLAYANERFVSAQSWARFFGKGDGKYILDKEALRTSCIEKISEADERYQYVGSFVPVPLDNTKKELEMAKAFLDTHNYEQCLFSASKAKAQANTVLSSVYVEISQADILLDQKLNAAAKVIARQSSKGQFPILGYSYYEYSQTLRKEVFSALLYAEYSLELGNLDMYFKQQRLTPGGLDPEAIADLLPFGLALLAGSIFGFVIAAILFRKPKQSIKQPRYSKRRQN